MDGLYDGRHARDDCSCKHDGEHWLSPPSGELACRRCSRIAELRAMSKLQLEEHAQGLLKIERQFVSQFSDLDISAAKIVRYEADTFSRIASAYNRVAEIKKLVGRRKWSETKAADNRPAEYLSARLGDIRDEFERRAKL